MTVFKTFLTFPFPCPVAVGVADINHSQHRDSVLVHTYPHNGTVLYTCMQSIFTQHSSLYTILGACTFEFA